MPKRPKPKRKRRMRRSPRQLLISPLISKIWSHLRKKSKMTTFSMLASTVEVLYESTSTHMRLIELMNIMPSIMQALQTELLLFFLIKRRITMKTDRRE